MRRILAGALLGLFPMLPGALAQSPDGPMAPSPDTPVERPRPQSEPRLKVRVSLVNTPVTVRDSRGEMIHDLEERNFRITDNGVEQKIGHFDLGGEPLSLVILMETSSRVETMLPELRRCGILLTQAVMGPSGEAALVGFDDSVLKLQGFTSNQDEIEKAVSRLKAGMSGSRLFDAMSAGVEMLMTRPEAKPEEPGRRRVLLVLAEATDFGSAAKLGEVLRQAQLANVTIYSVGLSTTRAELAAKEGRRPTPVTPPGTFGLPPQPGIAQTPSSEEQRQGNIDLLALAVWAVSHAKDAVKDHALEIAATATGGTHIAAFKDSTIEKALDEIGAELHAQYSLAYRPVGAGDTGYHEIRVSLVDVRQKNLKVRARPGYYIAPPES